MSLCSSVRAGTQDEHPTGTDRRWQCVTKQCERDWLPCHQRVLFSSELRTDTFHYGQNLNSDLFRSHNPIQLL